MRTYRYTSVDQTLVRIFDGSTLVGIAPAAEVPDDAIVLSAPAPLAADLIARVKAEAGRRINDIAPEYVQRNLTARAAELALTYPGLGFDDLPEPEKTEAAAGRALWVQIKAIRAKSNEIEASVAELDAAGRSAFDPTADDHWAD